MKMFYIRLKCVLKCAQYVQFNSCTIFSQSKRLRERIGLSFGWNVECRSAACTIYSNRVAQSMALYHDNYTMVSSHFHTLVFAWIRLSLIVATAHNSLNIVKFRHSTPISGSKLIVYYSIERDARYN